MKNFSLTLTTVLFLLLNNFSAFAQKDDKKENDNTICLQLIGVAVEKDNPINGVQVTLFKENEEMEWDEISSVPYHEHSFSFDLLKNSYYTIEVAKPGYITRSISVSTALPDSVVLGANKFVFEFDVELFKEKKGVDDYYFDFPVAIISYNKFTDVFENNERYTKHIKSRIKEALYPQKIISAAAHN